MMRTSERNEETVWPSKTDVGKAITQSVVCPYCGRDLSDRSRSCDKCVTPEGSYQT
jgi:predicted amidophosphoribosyltransferase